jgi:CRP-like cAMP-binding protein
MIYEKGEPISFIYFPLRGMMISLVIPLEDGALIEAGVVGHEAAGGLSTLTGYKNALQSAMVQMPGEAMRIRSSVMLDRCRSSAGLSTQVLLYCQVIHSQIAQSVACNARHNLPERLARWLLIAHDRADGDTLPLTHEFMSIMLGTRRSGVTIAVNTLKNSGSISLQRSRVQVVRRALLQASACECYASQRDVYRELIGWPATCSIVEPIPGSGGSEPHY